MDKIDMREWVANLEMNIDGKLNKWLKINPVENPESVILQWQFEQTVMMLSINWADGKESVMFHCVGPVACHRYVFFGLNDRTFNKVCDRVGNLAQVVMHPPIDPFDSDE